MDGCGGGLMLLQVKGVIPSRAMRIERFWLLSEEKVLVELKAFLIFFLLLRCKARK